MKKYLKLLVVTVVLSLIVAFTSLPFSADLGGFSGDSDFGGSWDSGSDWDSDWGSDYDYDYGYDSDFDLDLGSAMFLLGDGGGVSAIVILAIALFIYFRFIRSKNNTASVQTPIAPGATGVDRSTLRSIESLKQADPLFSEETVTEKLSNLYVQMQNCCTEKDLEPLRPYFTDALYSQFDRQVEILRKAGQTNRIERISVLDVDLLGYTTDDANDTLYARLKTRIVDYIVDDRTGAVVSGSKTAEKFMEYDWALIRSKGTLTQANDEQKVINCPNCGAPLNINHSAKCEYCDSVITLPDFDWAISSVKGISQRTAG